MSAQVGSSSFTDDTWAMGLSPKRYRQSRSSDLFYVGSVVLVAVALVVWALYGWSRISVLDLPGWSSDSGRSRDTRWLGGQAYPAVPGHQGIYVSWMPPGDSPWTRSRGRGSDRGTRSATSLASRLLDGQAHL